MSRTATIVASDRSSINISTCQQLPGPAQGKEQVKQKARDEEATLAALPPLASLQAWVHRPQAVAKCTVGDVFAMRVLGAGDGRVGRGDEVFLLDKYPCRMVEVVGWVASVDDKLDKMFITLDDGDGKHIISIHLRLQIHKDPTTRVARPSPARPPQPPPAAVPDTPMANCSTRSTFLSAQQRKIRRDKELAAAARLQARAAQIAAEEEASKLAQAKSRPKSRPVYRPGISEEYKGNRYVRRDIRVGDTIRVVARVDEWDRRRAEGMQVVRGLWCDEASGGKLEVVHPDEQFTHLAQVQKLRQELYSATFVMPPVDHVQPVRHLAPTHIGQALQGNTAITPPSPVFPPSTPTKRKAVAEHEPMASPSQRAAQPTLLVQGEASLSYSYADSLDLDSTAYSEMSSFADHALPDVSALRLSQLTENTYRRYVLDCMICQVQEAIETITKQGDDILDKALNAVFPEYTTRSTGRTDASEASLAGHGPSTPLRELQQGVRRYNALQRSSSSYDDEATPKAFRSRATRQAAAAAASARSDIGMCNSSETCISGLKFHSFSSSPSPTMAIPAFTLDSLANIPHLQSLGGSIADATAKTNERRRRRRVRDGEATDRDRAVEQDRIAKGRRADEYHLSKTERRKEVLRMTRRALREISEDGGIVQVASAPSEAAFDSSSQYSYSDSSSRSFIGSTLPTQAAAARSRDVAYIPITPPLILPLLQRFIDEDEAQRQRHFMNRHDPRRGHGMLIPDLTRRLAEYGQEGRWERVGEWHVEDALLWGCERGAVLRKGDGYRLARRGIE